MKRYSVKASETYDVIVGDGLLDNLGEYVKEVRGVSKAMVVTDSNVKELYLDRAVRSLNNSGFQTCVYVFEAGEQSKTAQTYLEIIDALAQNKFLRCDLVVALGGGVVGDIAGFAAATYMRGIDVVQVPTTLLAMTDSAIGGKTGVDLSQGKNLLGAFHQPKLVLADTDTLSTMQQADWKNGIGEGIKYALLCGGRVLDILSEGLNEKNISEFVCLCGEYKASVVAADEKESGMRKLLNLGHTLGHAIEKSSGYSISHGIAVAQGIMLIASAQSKHGELDTATVDTVKRLLEKYAINTQSSFDLKTLIDCIALDKKAGRNNTIDVVLIKEIGECRVAKFGLDEFAEYIGK